MFNNARMTPFCIARLKPGQNALLCVCGALWRRLILKTHQGYQRGDYVALHPLIMCRYQPSSHNLRFFLSQLSALSLLFCVIMLMIKANLLIFLKLQSLKIHHPTCAITTKHYILPERSVLIKTSAETLLITEQLPMSLIIRQR